MKSISTLLLTATGALFVSCATATPPELLNARTAYHEVSTGQAARLVPADVHKAREALLLAEQSFQNAPKSYRTRDLAYVAQRKAELARALGTAAADQARKAQADADFVAKQAALVKQGKLDLSESEQRNAQAAAAAASAATAASTAADAASEALRASEQRTAEARIALAKLAAVKEDERGLVLTLSGSVLLQSGKSTLLRSAQSTLDRVAEALLAVRTRHLRIEGYTDSRGSDEYNQTLSQRRAEAVRNYLVHAGYPSDLVEARGMGESGPIADNASAEGRANNRRVEIVIARDAVSSRM